ncbi:MAG: hypothetical protein IT323_13750, partial [Anaerolineae bacterium]|nr:hypothetical protein [Anaerolineae bacterium]
MDAGPFTFSRILNLLSPWITLGLVLYLLVWVQRWTQRHLFGAAFLAFGKRGPALISYLLVLAPGILLREGSRWVVAGMMRQTVDMILPPYVDDDGVVNYRIFHFLIINPFWNAVLAATPFLVGTAAVLVLAIPGLDVPGLLAAIGANDAAALRAALNNMVSQPLFVPALYLIFAIANTMLPTRQELVSIGFLWFVPVVFFAVLAAIGLWGGIILIIERWVTPVLQALTFVLALVLAVHFIAAIVVWFTERIVERATARRIQYEPPALPARREKARLPEPTSVKDLRLPVPPPPGAALPARKTAAQLESGSTSSQPRVTTPERGELPARTTPDRPELPARATGTDLPVPAPPARAAPPPPAPARPLPGAPPPRLGAAPSARDLDEDELSEEELDALTAPPTPRPGSPAPLRPPSATPSGPARPATGSGDVRRPESPRPAGAGSSAGAPSPLSPAARNTGVQGGPGAPARAGAPGASGAPSQGTRPGLPQPAEVGRRPGAPSAPASPAPVSRDLERPARPAPKPLTSVGQPRSPASADDDDFIDADVIDEEAIDQDEPEKPTPRPIFGAPQP